MRPAGNLPPTSWPGRVQSVLGSVRAVRLRCAVDAHTAPVGRTEGRRLGYHDSHVWPCGRALVRWAGRVLSVAAAPRCGSCANENAFKIAFMRYQVRLPLELASAYLCLYWVPPCAAGAAEDHLARAVCEARQQEPWRDRHVVVHEGPGAGHARALRSLLLRLVPRPPHGCTARTPPVWAAESRDARGAGVLSATNSKAVHKARGIRE